MPSTKISALTDGTALALTDRIPVARAPFASGDNRYISGTEMATFVANNSGGLDNVVEDTTPQLGGTLDANGNNIAIDDGTGILDESGNEQVVFQTTASAVNYLEIQNAPTGSGATSVNSPVIRAVGSDTHIGIRFEAQNAPEVPFHFIGGYTAFPEMMFEAHTAAPGGPTLDLYWNHNAGSGSLGAGGGHVVSNNNSAGTYYQSGSLAHYITDRVAGAENGYWYFTSKVAGVKATGMAISGGGTCLENGPSNPPLFPGTGNLAIRDGKGFYDFAQNQHMLFTQTTSAVNYINITNAATLTDPIIAAAGDDTNVGLTFTAKGGPAVPFTFNFGSATQPESYFTSTGTGAFDGPTWTFYHNSSSPASSDAIGSLQFNGKDSGGAETNYASIHGLIRDTTNPSEYGAIQIQTRTSGSKTQKVRVGDGVIIGTGTTDPGVGNLLLSTTGSFVKTTATTVGSLVAAATAGAGARAFVTDATVTTFASVVAGTGSNGVPVYSDGTNWRIG